MVKSKVDKYEKLTTSIQRKLDGNPVILVGSGGSIPYGLPSMLDLAKEITDRLSPALHDQESWKAFQLELSATGNFELALGKTTLTEEVHNMIIEVIWAYIDRKDREALSSFLRSGSIPAITPILRKFVQQTNPTNIITTNYDRLIEYAIDAVQGITSTGFSGDCVRTFNSFKYGAAKRAVNLFKVHGSIDWFKHRINKNILATPFFDSLVLKHIYQPMIVTPGNEKYKETHNDPFRAVITEADRALRGSAGYLCIGYGFNDEHIQPIIIDENRNKNKPIVIVTKNITDKMRELFLDRDSDSYLIISESKSGGTTVHYSNSDFEDFTEKYWNLDVFYKLWFE
jgi:hypothetical protein